MARIVYSCCGEGRGHSSRTLTMTRALRELGHEVLVLAARKAHQVLHPLIPDVREIPGLFFIYANNQVQMGASIRGNLPLIWSRRAIARDIVRMIEPFQPDLAITDFDPFLPIAAKMLGVPYISLDHQHVIPHLKLDVPGNLWAEFQAARWVVNLTHRGELANLVTSYFHAKETPDHVHCLPPILREEVLNLTPRNEGHVVVYQTSASFHRLPELLKSLPFQFRVYAFDQTGTDGNITYRPRSTGTFLEDVAGADWVLSNGGYTLISECLHFGKPVFSVPVDRQFEQWINAWHLEQLGYGLMCSTKDFGPRRLEEFVARRESFRQAIARQEFNGNATALDHILKYVPGHQPATGRATGVEETTDAVVAPDPAPSQST